LSYTRRIRFPSLLNSGVSIRYSGFLLAFARRAFFSHHQRPLPERRIRSSGIFRRFAAPDGFAI